MPPTDAATPGPAAAAPPDAHGRAGDPARGPAAARRRALPRLLAALGAGAALLAGFAAYLSPHLVLDLANLAWSCFR